MKRLLITILTLTTLLVNAQQFEQPKLQAEDFKKLQVKIGGDLTLQYQAISHSAKDINLIPLGKGFNLPTANLNLSAIISPGIKVNLTTYLSSRHHEESWVKDGYLLIDALTFLNKPAIDDLFKNFRMKIGMMEINYGDYHFRRSDNGNTINNQFVGNYIMDAFTTSVGIEMYYFKNDMFAMFGLSNGALKPELAGYNSSTNEYTEYNTAEELAYIFKIGFDRQFREDLRVRISSSVYISPKHHKGSLYSAERAGSRYYMVMNEEKPVDTNITDEYQKDIATDAAKNAVNASYNASSGRWGPGTTSENKAYMLNLFTKYKMFEFFGTYEITTGETTRNAEFDMSQKAIEGIMRLGKNEQFYLGIRYDRVTNDLKDAKDSINRLQIAGGWDLTKNLKAKIEYITQKYKNFTKYPEGKFHGIMMEFAVSF